MLDLVSAVCVSLCNKCICTPSQDQIMLTAAIHSRILCRNLLPITGTQKVLKGNASLSGAVLKLRCLEALQAQGDDIADHIFCLLPGHANRVCVSAMTTGFLKSHSFSLYIQGGTRIQ